MVLFKIVFSLPGLGIFFSFIAPAFATELKWFPRITFKLGIFDSVKYLKTSHLDSGNCSSSVILFSKRQSVSRGMKMGDLTGSEFLVIGSANFGAKTFSLPSLVTGLAPRQSA